MTRTESYIYTKELAIQEAERKIKQGKLFKSDDESKESQDFTNGDPETLFSLASLYAQFIEDDFNNAVDVLLDTLQEEFPDYL